jgi:hypothetical protein
LRRCAETPWDCPLVELSKKLRHIQEAAKVQANAGGTKDEDHPPVNRCGIRF